MNKKYLLSIKFLLLLCIFGLFSPFSLLAEELELTYYGIGYGNLEFNGKILRQQASFYKDAGSNWVRFIDVSWNDIEPEVPLESTHNYIWEKLDYQISEWENAGFSVQLTINPYSKWASKREQDPLKKLEFLGIKEERIDDYKKFVKALVSRYNLDGWDDQPGLKYPVRYYSVGFDFATKNIYEIDQKDFESFIIATKDTVKENDKNAKLILSGFNLENVFDVEMKEKYVEGKFHFTENQSFHLNRFLKLSQYCDVIEFKSDYSYTGLFDSFDYIKTHLQELSINNPIWVSVLLINPVFFYRDKTYLDEYRVRAEYITKVFANKLNPKYKMTYDWMLVKQANLLLKKAAITKALGADRVIFESLEDWQTDFGFTGFTDNQANRRPSFFALKLAQDKFGDAQFTERLDLGEYIYAFKFEKSDKTIIVLWYDNGVFYYPWQTPPKVKISLDITAKSAIVSKNITKDKHKEAESITKPVRNNLLTIVIDETPSIVEY